MVVALLVAVLGVASAASAQRATSGKDPLPVAVSPSASASASSSYRVLTIALPRLPADHASRYATASDDWYTGYPPVRIPVVRLSPGVGFRAKGRGESAFVFDALVGARLGLTPGSTQWGLFPEAGYGYNRANQEHVLTAGVGLGRGELHDWGYVALMPRFVWQPGRGLGGRLGLATQVTETGLSAEIALQQMTQARGERVSDVRLTLGLDVFLLGSVVSGNRAWRNAAR
jgi:hypothetical protein